jgi:L-threonylcarbamoyladenylate synthase
MKTEILEKNSEGMDLLIQYLQKGKLAIIPSENVYGFAGNGFLKSVADRIYNLKQRDLSKAFAIYTTREKADNFGCLTKEARRIISIWPAGIGIVVKKKPLVPEFVTAGKNSVLLVCVDEFLEILAEKADFPIIGTSANISNHNENIDFESVYRDFNGKVDLIIRGEPSSRGKGGSIVDCTDHFPKILRLGAVQKEKIQEIIPKIT